MARRASFPSYPPPPTSREVMPHSTRTPGSSGGPPSVPGRASVPPPPPSRFPSAPGSQPAPAIAVSGYEAVPLAAVVELLDRLSASDDSSYLVAWLEGAIASRPRLEPAFAVRLLRAYRETGRLDRARELATSLPASPSTWPSLDAARLAIERAVLAQIDRRIDVADAELRQANRSLQAAPRGSCLREQLDLHVVTAQVELAQNRAAPAAAALRTAEHIADRIEDGPWKTAAGTMLGHLAMRLADPRTAARHFAAALSRAPTAGNASVAARGHLALALGSIGRYDEARTHATQAISGAAEVGITSRHADAFDVLALVEISADRPLAALHAIDEAQAALGDVDHAALRYQLAEHRAWALAQLGRLQGARQWLSKAEQLRRDAPTLDPLEELDLHATRARVLEACGEHREAIAAALPWADRHEGAFVNGALNVILARAALVIADETLARTAVERAALSGDRHGWVFADRTASRDAWQLARRSGDSRVVRYAEKMIGFGSGPAATIQPPASTRNPSFPSFPPVSEVEIGEDGDELIYVTTLSGVARVKRSDLDRCTAGAQIIVDTLTHALRVDDREVSLERRRALEPLVVQLLRRAREGLSADEVLRAAGGPGPESADAEHRVRVLISRVRDLLGDAGSIERVRDAGEHGRTRYRLSAGVRFALVEPLYPGGT